MSPWQDIPANLDVPGWERILVRKPRHGGGWCVEMAERMPSGWKINPITGRGIEGFTQWMPIPP